MGDRLDRLEAELSAMRPAPLTSSLLRGIENGLREPARWNFADRCLAGAMSVGAIAACVIGGIVIWQNVVEAQSFQSAQPGEVAHSGDLKTGPTLGQYQQAVARAGNPAELFR